MHLRRDDVKHLWEWDLMQNVKAIAGVFEVAEPLPGVQVGGIRLIKHLSFSSRIWKRVVATIVASFLIEIIASIPLVLLVQVVVVVRGVVIVSLRPASAASSP